MRPAKKTRRITQDDVAAIAGVTRASVSYVLTGRGEELKITPEVIRRVKAAAKKLNYIPHYAARSLAAGKSFMLGLVLPLGDAVQHRFWSRIALGVESETLKAGYDILLISPREDVLLTARNYLVEKRVDALVVLAEDAEKDWGSLPVTPVVLGVSASPKNAATVRLDGGAGFAEAVEALAGLGHRDLLWFNVSENVSGGGRDRDEAVMRTAKKLGLAVRRIVLSGLNRVGFGSSGQEIEMWNRQIESALRELQGATAAVCWNDAVALGFYGWLAERGLRPGRDVSVVGFDDHFADTAVPALSSISYRSYDLGAAAARLALDIVRGHVDAQSAPGMRVEIPATFVRRASVAPPKA